jgi:hypothetical protein
VFDDKKLFGERSTAQFLQVGELPQEGLALLFQVSTTATFRGFST